MPPNSYYIKKLSLSNKLKIEEKKYQFKFYIKYIFQSLSRF